MNILFLIRSLDCGGTERQLALLAKGLHQRGHQVVVSCFYSGGLFEEEITNIGIKLCPLHKRGRWDLCRFLFGVFRVVRQERPDIIHGYLDEPNIISTSIRLLFPKVKSVWGIRSSTKEISQYEWLGKLTFKLGCILSRFAHAIIANSDAGRIYYVTMGYPNEKIVVIPNGIDTAIFQFDSGARIKLRSEWGISEHQKLIGIVGRLHPVKDHQTFLMAAALLGKTNSEVRFVCVGYGPHPYKESLKRFTRELQLQSSVKWVNTRSDISSI